MEAIKAFGQHFLIAREVAEFMVDAASISKKDVVLEIGPGKGMITKYLARKSKKLYYIEKDVRLKEALRYILGDVEAFWGDALVVSWPEEINKLVSNLPFNIASQVIFKIPETYDLAILGVQKEFGEKMVAKPGDKNYGRLSVSSQLLFNIKLLNTFPPEVFSPRPEVGLAIIKLIPKKRLSIWPELEIFIRDVFCYPNKTVNNALKLAGYDVKTKLRKKVRGLSKEEVVKLFKMLHK
ncbi:MAG: ribosomal RNA small subunit methyltransferase A [Candidatus Altiarchaeota archaeon]|nr:ribosomal RNA small subunit methyltransferase A [Candidatus Altiarchaeota archaeon]